MSTPLIAAFIVGALILLVLAAYSIQMVERNREKKRQLELVLKKRTEALLTVSERLPAEFLPHSLALLIARGCVDSFEQLHALNNRQPAYAQGLSNARAQLEQLRAQPDRAARRVRLQNEQQCLEAERNLNLLIKVIASMVERNQLTAAEAQQHQQQIQRLLLQSRLDSHQLQAQQARTQNKPRLAAHHLKLAIDILKKSGGAAAQPDITEMQNQVAELEQLAQRMEQHPTADSAQLMDDEQNKEWEQFSKKDESWKKKEQYD